MSEGEIFSFALGMATGTALLLWMMARFVDSPFAAVKRVFPPFDPASAGTGPA